MQMGSAGWGSRWDAEMLANVEGERSRIGRNAGIEGSESKCIETSGKAKGGSIEGVVSDWMNGRAGDGNGCDVGRNVDF